MKEDSKTGDGGDVAFALLIGGAYVGSELGEMLGRIFGLGTSTFVGLYSLGGALAGGIMGYALGRLGQLLLDLARVETRGA